MMRVYATLRRRIMEGDLAPGVRLDPARLQDELASSTTPIRDALHRLAGEGLVESWQNEGFRTIEPGEPAIRDLYEWCGELLLRCLAAVPRHADVRHSEPERPGFADAMAALFLDIAALSPNHEHRRAVANLSERSFLLWIIEEPLHDDALVQLEPIRIAFSERAWGQAARALDSFQKRRLALVPAIAARLRERASAVRPLIF